MIAVHRPGRQRPARPRGVPGGRLPADVRPRHARWPSGSARSHDADRLPEYVARAFHTAMQGRPGPVVLALPEDMLTTPTVGAGAAARRAGASPAPAPERAARSCARCSLGAERPFVIVGGSGWTPQSCDALRALRRALAAAGRLRVPLPGPVRQPPSELRRRRRHRHQSRSSRRASREADLVLAIGPRLGEMTTGGYTLLERAACRRRSWSTSMPAPRSSAASTPPSCCIAVVDGRAPRRRSTTLDAAADAARGRAWTARGARRLRSQPACRRRSSRSTWPRSCKTHRSASRPTTRSTPTAPATSAAGCTASAATRAAAPRPHAARADVGRDGLRRAGRRRRGAAASASARSSTSPATATS